MIELRIFITRFPPLRQPDGERERQGKAQSFAIYLENFFKLSETKSILWIVNNQIST